ncbi:ABC transporter permease [Paenibacillus sp. 7124]|uniref:Transport permease protein n=1 Tax=Paenibacillus apii TaxID=1850370 RepID=A0A6M1PUH8_9BACL|nr:ABC transporter permease [Paenibacillus apii]NGM85605.1 ABC transporter permease [Paenibacillus apii]NJJ40699.1 ABC transporter permease [Paenibacillus apii]
MSAGTQLKKLFIAQLKTMFREKAVWFWNLFFPVILMVLFMVIFGGGGDGGDFKAKVALVKPAQTAASDSLEAGLRKIPVFEWKSEQAVDSAQADKWVKDKDVDAAIVLPENGSGGDIRLIVNAENETNATTQAIRGILDRYVQEASFAAAGVEPAFRLQTSSVSSGSKDISSADFLLTGMISLSIAQAGLFGMVDMVEIRRSGLLKRLRMTPMRMGLYGLGGMLVRFVLSFVQIVLLTVIGVFGFGANLHLNLPVLIIAFFIGVLAFNALGYLISSFSKSLESYMGVANITSFLMMFISGVFFSTSSLPDWLKPVTRVLPLTYFVEGMRDGMVYGSGLFNAAFWSGIGILALWGAAAFALGALIYRKAKVEVR